MKIIFILGILGLTSCEMSTMKYGFFWNPEKVLLMAREAVLATDTQKWSEVSSEEALCLFGDTKGLNYLKREFKSSTFTGIKLTKITTHKLNVEGDVVFNPNYTKNYTATLNDESGRLKAKINILCSYTLPSAVAARDAYNTSKMKNAVCSVRAIELINARYTGNPVCL